MLFHSLDMPHPLHGGSLQHAGLLKTELACTEMASEVEVAAAFAAAPMLGRWAQTLQLARSLQSYGRNIAV